MRITVLYQQGQVKTGQGHSKKLFSQFIVILAEKKNKIFKINHITRSFIGKGEQFLIVHSLLFIGVIRRTHPTNKITYLENP